MKIPSIAGLSSARFGRDNCSVVRPANVIPHVWDTKIDPLLSTYMGPRCEEVCRQFIRLRPEGLDEASR